MTVLYLSIGHGYEAIYSYSQFIVMWADLLCHKLCFHNLWTEKYISIIVETLGRKG